MQEDQHGSRPTIVTGSNEPQSDSRRKVFTKIQIAGPNDCWLYTGYYNETNRTPYWRHRSKNYIPYRLVYELVTGTKLPHRLQVRHSCDNRRCCNPAHLEPGTQQQNSDDMKERDRHGLPKLAIKAIRRAYANGVSPSVIARNFGVTRQAVHCIVKKQTHAND